MKKIIFDPNQFSVYGALGNDQVGLERRKEETSCSEFAIILYFFCSRF